MFMGFKKFISVLVSISCVMSMFVFQANAAKSADLNNTQLVAEVEKFNSEKLNKLQKYIQQIGNKSKITDSLEILYDRLNNLVVPNIELARELNEPHDFAISSSKMGCRLGRLFCFLDIINREYTQDTFTAEMRADSLVKLLVRDIDRIGL